MEISRKQLIEEQKLRMLLRRALIVEKKKERKAVLKEEKMLRKLVRSAILAEAANTAIPHRSTGINVLEDLLKKIIPQLEPEFRKLTTSEEQRDSFRAHIISAVQNTLAPTRATDEADDEQDKKFIDVELEEVDLMEAFELEEVEVEVGGEEVIDIEVDDEAEAGDEEEFIDIETDGAGELEEPEEPSEEDQFGLEGEDETGRNLAFVAFNKIEKSITEAYDTLSDDEDKALFYDYLLTNLKLYFDKFEEELKADLPEPTTAEYEKEKDKLDSEPTEEEGEEGSETEDTEGGDDELDLEL
jgi:hypothetical protein